MNHADKISESLDELDRLSDQQKLTLRRDRIQLLIGLIADWSEKRLHSSPGRRADWHRPTPEPETVALVPQRRTGRLVSRKSQDPFWQTQLRENQPPAFIFTNRSGLLTDQADTLGSELASEQRTGSLQPWPNQSAF